MSEVTDSHRRRPNVPPQPARRTSAERSRAAVKGPVIGLLVNLMLVIVKIVAGLVSGSVALLADAGHSCADLLNNLMVIGALVYAGRPADESHPYGHDRAEVLVAASSAHLLTAAGVFLGWESVLKLISGTPTPSLLALWVAVATIVVKLFVTRIESIIAHEVTSQAVLADARDSLTDVFSALTVVIAVIGAHLGQSYMDGLGGIVIACIILWTAVRIGVNAGNELMERNLDDALIDQVRAIAGTVPGVLKVTAVTGRPHGSDVLVELGIVVDPQATVDEGAAIAENVRRTLVSQRPEIGNVLVELNADHVARLQGRLV